MINLASFNTIDLKQPIEERIGVSRRQFLQFCAAMAASMGLPIGSEEAIAAALQSKKRPPVIWLPFQECTGCTESLLRAEHPTIVKLILDVISLDYHETLMAAAGHQAHEALEAARKTNKGKYVLICDGSVPVKDNGVYCKIGGRTAIDLLKDYSKDAAAVIAMGSCAAWGGMPSSKPNPTGASGLGDVLGKDKPVINIPGCPPNPYNLLSTVVHFLTFGKLPELDQLGRPKFAYGRLIHENCERRAHFDAGRFAMQFGDDGHKKGYCLYKLGCKGPETHANCPAILFGDVGNASWPVGTGHPCIGCTEKGIGFEKPIHALAELKTISPPVGFARVDEPQGAVSLAAAAALGALAGAALVAGTGMAKNLGKHPVQSAQQSTDKAE